MSWARLDDGWHDHPKVVEAGCEAAGLWVMCLTWSHKARKTSPTPGVIPDSIITRFAGPRGKRLAKVLVEVGMFDERGPHGYPIHDFDDYLPKYDAGQAKAAGAMGGKARAAKQTASEPLGESPPLPPSEPVGEPPGEPLEERLAVSKQTSSTRASARRNPVPVPKEPNTSPAAAGDAFDRFWADYPRKEGRLDAERAWRKAIKIASAEDIFLGLKRWLPAVSRIEKRYIPHGSTWLNDGRWMDDPAPREVEATWDPWMNR